MIKITDCGDYFKITFDGLEVMTYPKSLGGFKTKEKIREWLRNKLCNLYDESKPEGLETKMIKKSGYINQK